MSAVSLFIQDGLNSEIAARDNWKQTPLAQEYAQAKEKLKQLAQGNFPLVQEIARGYSFKTQKIVQRVTPASTAIQATREQCIEGLSAFDKIWQKVEADTTYRPMRREKVQLKSMIQTRAQMLDPAVQCVMGHERVSKWVSQVSSEEDTERVLAFYQGSDVERFVARSNAELERDCLSKYWVFPNPTRSVVFPETPILTPTVARYLREHPERLMQAFQRMLVMYGFEWVGEGQPLLHRFQYPWAEKQQFFNISRILITLKAAGLEESAGRPFLKALFQAPLGVDGVMKWRQWEHILDGNTFSR
jgi:hypothetical protein